MRAKWAAVLIVLGVLCLLAGPGSPAAASEADEINKFYSTVLAVLKKGSHLSQLVALVEKNPAVANRCLVVCRHKAQVPGEQGEALRLVYTELQTAFIVASKPARCDGVYVQQILTMAGRLPDEDDRIFCLERLTGFCPNTTEAWIILGDLYLKQPRCGMAVRAYKKTLELSGDEDSRKLLAAAVKCQEEDLKQKPLNVTQLKDLVVKDSAMSPVPGTVRKVSVGNSIQRQVLFDEWSSQIKDQFLPDLKTIGEGLKEALSTNPGVRLVIAGHTDKRGPLEKNMMLSKARAEAIKDYLVQYYGIDAAQLTTEGYGPTRPYSLDENEAGWALNRRVEFKKLH